MNREGGVVAQQVPVQSIGNIQAWKRNQVVACFMKTLQCFGAQGLQKRFQLM